MHSLPYIRNKNVIKKIVKDSTFQCTIQIIHFNMYIQIWKPVFIILLFG